MLIIAVICVSAVQAQKKIGGLALYTVRAQMGESPKETLKEVSDIGYRNIEAAGYQDGTFYGMPPSEFKTYLKEIGLNPVSTHQSSVTLENADQQIADAKAAGFTYFVVPIPPMGMFAYNQEEQKMYMKGTAQELADVLQQLGAKCKAAGLQLLYHNHNFEFEEDSEGRIILDYLLENTDPENVNFQLDLYWATRASVDPVAYFEKYPGRFKSWHVKDMDTEGRFAPVGTGTIDFQRIFDYKKLSGMEFYFVEQDRTFDGQEPLEAIRISHGALEKIKDAN